MVEVSGNLAIQTTNEDEFGFLSFAQELTHDDWNSFYRFCTKNRQGEWKEVYSYTAPELRNADFSSYSKANCYITLNGFTRAKTRATGACRQINTVSFDIDCHNETINTEQAVSDAYMRIMNAIAAGKIQTPTMIVSTGRGLQIHYVLKNSVSYRRKKDGVVTVNESAIQLRQSVYEGYCKLFEEVIGGVDGVSVDTSTSDLARVMRIPGTINQANGKIAKLVYHAQGEYVSLADMREFLAIKKTAHRARILNLAPLAITRMSKLKLLQRHRRYDCVGTRHQLCFVFYNSAVQVYENRDEAFDELIEFNSRFSSPLPESELRSIRLGVDRAVQRFGPFCGERGWYMLSSKTIIDKIGLSAEEIHATGFFTSKRSNERAAAKAETREQRMKRNREVAHLALTGKTQAEIAKLMGLCRQTVAKILKEMKAYMLSDAARTALDARKTSSAANNVNYFGTRVVVSHGVKGTDRDLALLSDKVQRFSRRILDSMKHLDTKTYIIVPSRDIGYN